MLTKSDASRPALVVPTSNSGESFVRGGSENAISSPMTLVNSILGDHESYTDPKPFSQLLAGGLISRSFPPALGLDNNLLGNAESAMGARGPGNQARNQVANAPGFAEAHGFQASSGHSAKYRSMMPSRLPIPSSAPIFTIPPGLSPTTLLESPVLFSGGLADPSPTTGSFAGLLAIAGKDSEATTECNKAVGDVCGQSDSFIFKPNLVTVKQEVAPITEGHIGEPYRRPLERGDGQMQPQDSSLPSGAAGLHASATALCSDVKSEPHMQSSAHALTNESSAKVPSSHISNLGNHSFSYREKPTADGYNWKKYGQKQLKGSEFPRSYYKCTYPNCTVKKQVECSHDGEITEIMYKGDHSHPKPQSTRRMSRSGIHSVERIAQDATGDVTSVIGGLDCDRISADVSSSSLVISHTALDGTPEQSYCSPSDEENDGCKFEEGGEDEQDSKRRRSEDGKEIVANMPIRTIREPRVIVQTTSEVDILDDGYRWRKYGQKVVKGNHYPRSYYKCTNIGCIVRKHVERSSSDPKSVITTYEGKHNHNVPLPRGDVPEATGSTVTGPPPPSHATSGANTFSRPPVVLESDAFANEEDNTLTVKGNQTSGSVGGVPSLDYGNNSGVRFWPNDSGITPFAAGELGHNWGLRLPQNLYQSNSLSFIADRPLSRP